MHRRRDPRGDSGAAPDEAQREGGGWQAEVDEIARRHRLAEEMGGAEQVARQHAHGKLTVRERIERLADPGTFRETGKLAGSAVYEDGRAVAVTPANEVSGLCAIDGRTVWVSGGDFTVRGGAADDWGGPGVGHGRPDAGRWLIPCVHLLDQAGGSVRSFEKLGRTYIPDNPHWDRAAARLDRVPVVMAVMGSVAGGHAVLA
jgi:acetyl-CoA carboxylase carboxyltransferase component